MTSAQYATLFRLAIKAHVAETGETALPDGLVEAFTRAVRPEEQIPLMDGLDMLAHEYKGRIA